MAGGIIVPRVGVYSTDASLLRTDPGNRSCIITAFACLEWAKQRVGKGGEKKYQGDGQLMYTVSSGDARFRQFTMGNDDRGRGRHIAYMRAYR